MRRIETYVGQQIYEWMFSAQAQYNMTALAKSCATAFGTTTFVNGLACTPTSPAGMTVQVGAGELYQMEAIEATVCGTLPINSTYSILKQGIQLGSYTTATFAAPSSSGQSISYLIEAQYQDSDISLDPTTGNSPVVLQFYDAATPASPWSGPNNSSATSNTFRDGIIAYQIKAGVAATTGAQVTPTPDTGYVGLWVVTVPYGATSLTASNIAQYSAAPILQNNLLQMILKGNSNYAVDSGAANTYVATPAGPVPDALSDGLEVSFYAAHPNTGASTLNAWGFGAKPLTGMAGALQGGEIVVGMYRAKFSSASGGFQLVGQGAGALQVGAAVASGHAAQLGQVQSLLQASTANVGVDTGAAGACVVAFTPALSAPVPWAPFWFKVKNTNPGSCTLNASGTAYALVGGAHAALQGGELLTGGNALVYWNPTLNSGNGAWVLLECTGGSVQVPNATQSQHAVPLSQMAAAIAAASSGVRGLRSNLQISYTGTSAAVMVTANELSLENSAGAYFTMRNVNLTASSGAAAGVANSLDTGSWAYSTFYNLFVIYNPTTQTSALLWSLSATAPTLPSGYTYFARIGANKTQAATNYWFLNGLQQDAFFQYTPLAGTNLTSSPTIASGTTSGTVSTVGFCPATAAEIYVTGGVNTSGTSGSVSIASTSAASGVSVGSFSCPAVIIPIFLPNNNKNFYYSSSNSTGAAAVLGWIDAL